MITSRIRSGTLVTPLHPPMPSGARATEIAGYQGFRPEAPNGSDLPGLPRGSGPASPRGLQGQWLWAAGQTGGCGGLRSGSFRPDPSQSSAAASPRNALADPRDRAGARPHPLSLPATGARGLGDRSRGPREKHGPLGEGRRHYLLPARRGGRASEELVRSQLWDPRGRAPPGSGLGASKLSRRAQAWRGPIPHDAQRVLRRAPALRGAMVEPGGSHPRPLLLAAIDLDHVVQSGVPPGPDPYADL